jgi:hypothetical protein
MLKYGLFRTPIFLSRVKIRSSLGLVHVYIRDLGHPWVQGPELPYKAISSVWRHLSLFKRIKMIPSSVSRASTKLAE